MNPTVLGHTLRTGRMGLLWYAIGSIFAIVIGGVGLSTASQNTAMLENYVKQLPPALLEAFKIDAAGFTSPVGYISARSLGLVWPLVVIAFAAGSAGAVSAMIERGTIHFDLSLPIARVPWLGSRMVSGLIGLLVIVLVALGTLYAYVQADWWRFAVLGFAFGVFWLGVAFSVAAFARDRGAVTGIVFGVFGAQYLMSILAGLTSAKWLGSLSIWSAYQPEQVVNTGVPWATMALWVLIGTACFAVAAWRWRTRDIPA